MAGRPDVVIAEDRQVPGGSLPGAGEFGFVTLPADERMPQATLAFDVAFSVGVAFSADNAENTTSTENTTGS